MKKLISLLSIVVALIIITLMFVQFSSNRALATTTKSTTKTLTTVKVNNKSVSLKAGKPYIKGKITYMPVSVTASIGGHISFKSGKEVLTYKNLSAYINTGNEYATVGKAKIYLGGPVECNKYAHVFVPSSFFTRVFHAKIKVSGSTIYITKTTLKTLPTPKTYLKPTPKPTATPKTVLTPTPKSTPKTSTIATVKVNGKKITFSKNKPRNIGGLKCIPVAEVLKALKLKYTYKSGTLTSGTVEGKNITMDKTKGLFDYKGIPYMAYQAFEQLRTTSDYFDNNKMVVINAYSKKKLWTRTNRATMDLIEQKTIWQQVNLFKRLIQSDNYVIKKYPSYDYRSKLKVYVPKDKRALYFIVDPTTLVGQNYLSVNKVRLSKMITINQHDLLLKVEEKGFGEYTRHKVREILKMSLPHSYSEAYTDMMKVLREELWESKDNTSDIPCLEGWYTDSRTVSFRLADNIAVNTLVVDISAYGLQVEDIDNPYYNTNGRWNDKDVKTGWDKIIEKYGLDKE